MRVKLAQNYGFCFGVKRAIKIAESTPNSRTIGPLIHNPLEIERLKKDYSVGVVNDLSELSDTKPVVIRTHGIPKNDLQLLQSKKLEIIDATCPFVTKPQEICRQMSEEGYDIVIFGDIDHPEVKGVMSYAQGGVHVVLSVEELEGMSIRDKVAVVSQTTRKIEEFFAIVNFLIPRHKEVRVFNTICNATSENQDAAAQLSREVDVMLVIGGKNSSNTKQLFYICQKNCSDCYLVESEEDINSGWFDGKTLCGVTAGASTPDWIIERIVKKVEEL